MKLVKVTMSEVTFKKNPSARNWWQLWDPCPEKLQSWRGKGSRPILNTSLVRRESWDPKITPPAQRESPDPQPMLTTLPTMPRSCSSSKWTYNSRKKNPKPHPLDKWQHGQLPKCSQFPGRPDSPQLLETVHWPVSLFHGDKTKDTTYRCQLINRIEAATDIATWYDCCKVWELSSTLRGPTQSWWDSLETFKIDKTKLQHGQNQLPQVLQTEIFPQNSLRQSPGSYAQAWRTSLCLFCLECGDLQEVHGQQTRWHTPGHCSSCQSETDLQWLFTVHQSILQEANLHCWVTQGDHEEDLCQFSSHVRGPPGFQSHLARQCCCHAHYCGHHQRNYPPWFQLSRQQNWGHQFLDVDSLSLSDPTTVELPAALHIQTDHLTPYGINSSPGSNRTNSEVPISSAAIAGSMDTSRRTAKDEGRMTSQRWMPKENSTRTVTPESATFSPMLLPSI